MAYLRTTASDQGVWVYNRRMDSDANFDALQEAPPFEGLQTLLDTVFAGGHVLSVERLAGGIRCGMHAIEVQLPSGEVLQIVLRRYASELLEEDPESCTRDWHLLQLAQRCPVPVPQRLWIDTQGMLFGVPALAMTRLPGQSIPRLLQANVLGLSEVAEAAGRVLANIHGTRFIPDELGALPRRDKDTMWTLVAGSSSDEQRQRMRALPDGEHVWELLQKTWPRLSSRPPELVHGDFHLGNLLWADGSISGVLDWSDAAAGAEETDLVKLRWEFTLREGPEAADRALAAYESERGYLNPEIPIWDLSEIWRFGHLLRAWVWFFEMEGRRNSSLEVLQYRRDAYLKSVTHGVRMLLDP